MIKTNLKLSGAFSLASLLALAVLMMTTSPVDNIIYAAAFFALALMFLLSLGYFIVRLQTGEMTPKSKYRIVAISLVLLVLLMFRSAQSLSWVDGIILMMIGFGLAFYISRRS